MNIKKLVLACAAISLLYGGDAYAANPDNVIKKGIVAERAKMFGGQADKYKNMGNKNKLKRSVSAPANLNEGSKSFNKKSKDEKANARIKTMKLLSKIKKFELNKSEQEESEEEIKLTAIPENLLSGGKVGTYEYVGSKFGTHIQDVWNLSSDVTAGDDAVNALLTDLKNTATVISLSEEDPSNKKDAKYDFSEIDENDFQGIIAKNDRSKAFYLNAIAKIAAVLHKGTDGHVFWHGMFKVMVENLIAYYY